MTTLNLPLDVASRLEGLFLHISDTKKRATVPPALNDLIGDFEEMAHQYVSAINQALEKNKKLGVGEKWQKFHEAVDKLTDQWRIISNLVATNDLGSSFESQFADYLEQAKVDLGLTDPKDRFAIFPTFGQDFALTRFEYLSKPFYMLRLPISTVSAKWEWSIIWHEIAGIKVRKIAKKLKEHLDTYIKDNKIILDPPEEKKANLLEELLNRIKNDETIDKKLRGKLKPILFPNGKSREGEKRIWSIDWLEQLYEDSCSVLAFGDDFIFVLEKILSRNLTKLSSDRKHPNLETRLQVAVRINERKKRSNLPPKNNTEKLADELIWEFIVSQQDDPDCTLPVAFEEQHAIPPKRVELIDAMKEFKNNYSQSTTSPIVLEKLIKTFVQRGLMFNQSALIDVTTERGKKISNIFADAIKSEDVDALLAVSLSYTDELDIKNHNHIPDDQNYTSSLHLDTTINVHGEDHDVWGATHI